MHERTTMVRAGRQSIPVRFDEIEDAKASVISVRISRLLALMLFVSACAAAPRVMPAEEGAPQDSLASPWWEGRTWDGEIQVCIDALGDIDGCRNLADALRVLGCELKTYQTFAAGMATGGHFEVIHEEAIANGDCPLIEEASHPNL